MLVPVLLLALAAAPAPGKGPPTLAELGEIAYRDIVDETALKLERGLWRGVGWAKPGEREPILRLLDEPFATGDFDGDGATEEAAAVLAAHGSQLESYRLLAVAARRGGAVVNLGTFRLGDRVRVQSLTFADGALTAVIDEPVEETDFFRLRARLFVAAGDSAHEALPLAALGTTWWRLTEIDGRRQIGALQPWMGVSRGELVGTATCDRFRVPVEQRGATLILGTVERRRGRCTIGMERRDERFFALLAGAQRFEPGKDSVTLVTRDAKGEHRAVFVNAGQVFDRRQGSGRDPRPRPTARPTPPPPPR